MLNGIHGSEEGQDSDDPQDVDQNGRKPHINSAAPHSMDSEQDKGNGSDRRYYYLYQNATDGLFTVNYDGYLRDANRMCERITGYSSAELEKIHFSDLLAPREKRFICHYFEMIKKKQMVPRDEIQIEIIAKHNKPKVVELHIQNAIFEQGVIQASIRDVTDKKKLEDLLMNAQRMECLGKLVNDVSHKFNDILTAILGSSSYLRASLEKDKENYKYVETIQKSASMGADLVSQLMSFGSGQKFQSRLIDMNKVIQKTIKLMSNRYLLNRIKVVYHLQEGSLPVQIDEHQIMHALMNICHNAQDAMPNGGKLTITSRKLDLNDDFCLQNIGFQDGQYIHIQISDTGCGIEEKALPYIFDPFYTTKDVGQGTGLGLSVAFGIIKAHQGTILVDSKIGQGTQFNIYLPAHTASIAEEDGYMTAGKGRLMIVEDEELVRRITFNILERCGYEVLCAEDGEAAIDLYKEKGDSVDLVILDVIMPRKDGMETFRELKKLNKGIRVLVSTGYLPNNMSTEFLRGGAAGFIQKPYTAIELLKSVKKILS